MEHEEILIEARAKILWGQPPASVRSFLEEEGIPAGEIDESLEPYLEERRQDSIQGMGLGAMMTVGGFGGPVLLLLFAERISLRLIVCMVFAGFFGCYKLIDHYTNWRQVRR